MNAEDMLANLLGKVNSDVLRGFELKVQAITVGDGAGRRPPGDDPPDFLARLVVLVREFRDGDDPRDFRTLRLLCHGTCHYIAEDDYVLAGDLAALARLLRHVANHHSDKRRFRRLYDGLLRAYLGIDRQEAWFAAKPMRAGNEEVRAFLEANICAVRDLEPIPDWVSALIAYPEVISSEPGRRFSEDWLTGGGTAFRDASERLGLTGTSWLAVETLRSALETACALDDGPFAMHIPALLSAAGEARFRSLRDDIYASVLTRYAAVQSPPIHAMLRDALVHAWKNPWLARNDSAWARVSEKARTMVAGWLKLELIHQFFEVLSEDGKQDRSRFEFWRRYHETIDDAWFALGSRAFHSRSPDMAKLRAALDGRLLELVGAESDNNAFVMCMGDKVIVEFSRKGNAAYRYTRGHMTLDGSRRSIAIGELRHDASQRLIHRDTRDEDWQERFAKAIGRPVRTHHGAPSSSVTPRMTVPTPRPAQYARGSIQEIVAFARRFAIAFEDHRSKGGSLWLRVDAADPEIGSQLIAWGFNYRPGRGWWRAG